MFKKDLENKAKRLEEAYRNSVIDCGEGLKFILIDEIESAARDFVSAVNFISRVRGLEIIDTESYRQRMASQRISLRY